MTRFELLVLRFWVVLFSLSFAPALARAQPAADEIVVEAGTPVPVPLDAVADRLRAELPDASIRVGGAIPAAAGTVTMALTEAGELQIVYRDASGREATRIVADTRDPAAVAAAVAMIVANLHRSQLDSLLGTVAPAPPAPPVVAPSPPVAAEPAAPPPVGDSAASPAPPVVSAQPDPAPVVVAAPAPSARLVQPAAPGRSPGWVLDVGGLYAVVAVSGVAGFGYEFGSGVRVGARGNIAYVPDNGSTAFTLDGVLTFVGGNRPGHFDFGGTAGLLAVDSGTLVGVHIGPFVSYVYSLSPSVGIGARVGLDVALLDGQASVWPTGAIFLELPI